MGDPKRRLVSLARSRNRREILPRFAPPFLRQGKQDDGQRRVVRCEEMEAEPDKLRKSLAFSAAGLIALAAGRSCEDRVLAAPAIRLGRAFICRR
jgi:hypothetical protein